MREINPFLLDPEDSHDQELHFGSGSNDFSPEVTLITRKWLSAGATWIMGLFHEKWLSQ